MYTNAFGKARRLVLLAVDACDPRLLRKYIAEGELPNIAALVSRGTFANMLSVPLPPVTQPAWAAIATGAAPGTTGIHMSVHVPGEPLDQTHDGSDARFLANVETLWQVAERSGKRVVMHNFPCSWPPQLKNAVQIAAYHNQPARDVYYRKFDIAPSSLYTAGEVFSSAQVPGRVVTLQLRPARGWLNLPPSVVPPLEAELSVPSSHISGNPYVLLFYGRQEGYDSVLAVDGQRGRDAAQACANLRVGEMSDWIRAAFESREGPRPGAFRLELVALAPDASKFKIYATAIASLDGFTDPPEVGARLTARFGPYTEVDDVAALVNGWFDSEESYVRQIEYCADWWGGVNAELLRASAPDLLVTWIGVLDHTAHLFKGAIEPGYRYYDAQRAKHYEGRFRQFYKLIDANVGKILADCDLDETLVVIVSDHSHTEVHRVVAINRVLQRHGLLRLQRDDQKSGDRIDWSATKAIQPFGLPLGHIFVNLKGRDPEGIVEPGSEYEAVQEEIVDLLYATREEGTGRCPFQLAVPKQDAEALGIYQGANFSRLGDVLYVMKPGFSSYPALGDDTAEQIDIPFSSGFSGSHVTLPSSARLPATFIMSGPGVKRALARSLPVNIVDVAPTIAHLLGLPIPAQAEGSLIWDIME